MKKAETECRNRQSDNTVAENMRAEQASQFLACSRATIWLWVKQKKIKSYKLSDRVTIFKRSELEAFINGSTK